MERGQSEDRKVCEGREDASQQVMMESLRLQMLQSPIIPVVGELIRNHPGAISLGQGVVSYPPPQQAFDHIPYFRADPDLHKYQSVQVVPRALARSELHD